MSQKTRNRCWGGTNLLSRKPIQGRCPPFKPRKSSLARMSNSQSPMGRAPSNSRETWISEGLQVTVEKLEYLVDVKPTSDLSKWDTSSSYNLLRYLSQESISDTSRKNPAQTLPENHQGRGSKSQERISENLWSHLPPTCVCWLEPHRRQCGREKILQFLWSLNRSGRQSHTGGNAQHHVIWPQGHQDRTRCNLWHNSGRMWSIRVQPQRKNQGNSSSEGTQDYFAEQDHQGRSRLGRWCQTGNAKQLNCAVFWADLTRLFQHLFAKLQPVWASP